ncbi:P-loop containing nucleoside triphosphate hydrolase protein, partial [Vararia minispora EC-137]
PDEKLPPPPAILCGRDQEVEAVVDMILHKSPAHAAILGSGGIGKTSVALAVLHSPSIVHQFENQRFFVACDAATSADALVLEILRAFGMASESGVSPTTKVLAFLQASSCLLCLDNFETPWDADPRAVELFLAKVTSMPNTAVLITTRGSSRPLQTNWTKPLLPPLRPLTVHAALEAWECICGVQDSFAEMLVKAVDCVPLAVTLLAHLAEADCAEVVWMLWNKKFTAMVHTHDSEHRLSSVEFSIELSLQNPRIAANPYVLRVLGVLCMLPLGIRLAAVDEMEEAFQGSLPDILTSRLVLMQTSLAYSTDGFMRVLSPIRHYVQKRHCPEDTLLDHLEHYY